MRYESKVSMKREIKLGSLVAVLVSTLLLSTLGTISSSASTRPFVGGKCTTANEQVTVAKIGLLVCTQEGKKISWQYKPADIRIAVASATIQANNDVAIQGVAKGMGYFAAEKLTATNLLTGGSAAAVQAVGSGSADITGADLGSVMQAVEKGVNLRVVGSLVTNWPWRIAVLPGSAIKTGADLKGKKIGIISLASGSFPYAKAVMTGSGLEITDAEYIPVGLGAPAANALSSGSVDALALYTAVYAQIESAGTALRYLANPSSMVGVQSLVWVTTADFAEKNPQVIERFLRAAYKALTFSGTSPEKAMYIGYQQYDTLLAGSTKALRIGPDTKAITVWLESAGISKVGTTEGWPKTWGAISTQAWLRTQAYAQAAGSIKRAITIEDMWMPQFLAAANNFNRNTIIAQAKKYKPVTS
jgi:NitT/TauT family transport system substrate-binding protein